MYPAVLPCFDGGEKPMQLVRFPDPQYRPKQAVHPRATYVQRIPIADSCSMRSGEGVAALLRWLLTQAPSLSPRSSGLWPSLPTTIVSTCLRGTWRCPSRSWNCLAAA